MALEFWLITSTVVLVYAVWSAYFAFDTMRDDIRSFCLHELDEFESNLRAVGATPEGIERAVHDIAEVSEEPGCAFRVRNGAGAIVHEAGHQRLLRAIDRPIDPHASWRKYLWSDRMVVDARHMKEADLSVELLVDVDERIDQLCEYLLLALLVFIGTVALAGLTGFLTARRGLSGLRQVVAQASVLDIATGAGTIRVDDAPVEIRDVALALNGMIARIRRGLDDMRTFTASLAHELRSPLQNLIGEVEVTLLSRRSAESYEHILRSNLDDLNELSDAIDNLVAFCRTTEPSPRELLVESFDLAAESELRLARERRSAERSGVRIAVRASGDTRLSADREGCLRVLRNLVGNAIAFAPEGTEITVAICGEDGGVSLTVEDEGPGVPEEILGRIFEPFVSGRPLQGKRGGYGLGLAICRSVLVQHGGTLCYEPRKPRGARFVARFPRLRRGGDAAPPAPPRGDLLRAERGG